MKNRLITIILTLLVLSVPHSRESLAQSITSNVQVKANDLSEKKALADFKKERGEQISKYYTSRTQTFKEGVTEEEKEKTYQHFMDLFYSGYPGELRRFNRNEAQPKPDKAMQEKLSLHAKEQLEVCVTLVGAEKNDWNIRGLKASSEAQRPTFILSEGSTQDSFLINDNVQPSYLYGRTYKCTRFLYSENYNLSDFQYPKQNNLESNSTRYQQAEAAYTQAYLYIKSAGLLRKLPYAAYYPKSLVRAHADQTGLTNFIQKKEKHSGTQLDHQQLAIEYFGSYQKWIYSLNNFINGKLKKP